MPVCESLKESNRRRNPHFYPTLTRCKQTHVHATFDLTTSPHPMLFHPLFQSITPLPSTFSLAEQPRRVVQHLKHHTTHVPSWLSMIHRDLKAPSPRHNKSIRHLDLKGQTGTRRISSPKLFQTKSLTQIIYNENYIPPQSTKFPASFDVYIPSQKIKTERKEVSVTSRAAAGGQPISVDGEARSAAISRFEIGLVSASPSTPLAERTTRSRSVCV